MEKLLIEVRTSSYEWEAPMNLPPITQHLKCRLTSAF